MTVRYKWCHHLPWFQQARGWWRTELWFGAFHELSWIGGYPIFMNGLESITPGWSAGLPPFSEDATGVQMAPKVQPSDRSVSRYMEVSIVMGLPPVHHPFLDEIFLNKSHLFWGTHIYGTPPKIGHVTWQIQKTCQKKTLLLSPVTLYLLLFFMKMVVTLVSIL